MSEIANAGPKKPIAVWDAYRDGRRFKSDCHKAFTEVEVDLNNLLLPNLYTPSHTEYSLPVFGMAEAAGDGGL